jgi:hypothetical protein
MSELEVSRYSSLVTRSWLLPGHTLADVRSSRTAEDFARIEAAVVRMAGDEHGAWAILVDVVEDLGTQTSPLGA